MKTPFIFGETMLNFLKFIPTSWWLFGVLIISAGSTIYIQHNEINDLEQDIITNEKMIDEILQANNRLLTSLEQEKQAVISTQKFAKALQEKTNETKTIIKTVLKTEPCANTRLPNTIIDRLHKTNRH